MLSIKNNSKYLAIAILIGGKSTRFGSDKGLYKFRGKPLISHLLDKIYQDDRDIFIVASSIEQVQTYINKINLKNITAFIIDDNSIISDSTLHTPIIGLYSAFNELNNLGYKKAYVLSCDIPLIKKEVINYLITCSMNFECCIPQWDNGFLEPLCAIYPIKKALILTEENIKSKNYRLINILNKTWKIKYISIENTFKRIDEKLVSFININEPLDLKKLENL